MINTLIGKYKITRLIGEGGMASVYEAEHEMLGTKVAIKVLNPILSANTQIKERFRNEAKLMASLDHPHITKVIDFDEQPQQLSIIMEFLNGEDLSERIKRTGALNDKEVLDIFSQTFSAFQYAHEKGIVHRDIKPSNIFILKNGHVKILDFGIAKLFGQGNELTQTGTQMGTPIYMSPEQVKTDKSIDHRSDIYSLGVTMFYAINGKPLYNSDTDSQFDIFTKIVNEPILVTSLQSKFKGLVEKACQKNRELRYQSCAEYHQALSTAEANDQGSMDKTILVQDREEREKSENKVISTPHENVAQAKETSSATNPSPISPAKNAKSNRYFLGAAIVVFIGIGLGVYFNKKGGGSTGEGSWKDTVITVAADSIHIGNQIWMTKNLDVSTFRNGDVIPQASSDEAWKAAGENKQPAWCYYDNDPANGTTFGKLYNWYAVNDPRGLAPAGYHIPTDAEWTVLTDYLGGKDVAGKKMKSTSGWFENGNGTNSSGFSGLPGGIRYFDGRFNFVGEFGFWWCATEDGTGHPFTRHLYYFGDDLFRQNNVKVSGLSVRCVNDYRNNRLHNHSMSGNR